MKHDGGIFLVWICMAASRTSPLIIIADNDGSSRLNSSLQKHFSANLQRNVSKLNGKTFIMQKNNEPIYKDKTRKAFINGKMRNFRWKITGSLINREFIWSRAVETEEETSQKKQELRGSGRNLQKHNNRTIQQYDDVSHLRLDIVMAYKYLFTLRLSLPLLLVT